MLICVFQRMLCPYSVSRGRQVQGNRKRRIGRTPSNLTDQIYPSVGQVLEDVWAIREPPYPSMWHSCSSRGNPTRETRIREAPSYGTQRKLPRTHSGSSLRMQILNSDRYSKLKILMRKRMTVTNLCGRNKKYNIVDKPAWKKLLSEKLTILRSIDIGANRINRNVISFVSIPIVI
jgi:hypothetical protein